MDGEKQVEEFKWLDENTFELNLTIKKNDIQEEYQKVFENLAGNLEIKGFRRGKIPLKIAEKQIGKEKIYEQVIQNLLPKTYLGAIKKYNLQPITNPKFQIIDGKEGKDWQIKATGCQKPKVQLGDYKPKIKEINAKTKIWVPGKEEEKTKSAETLKKEKEEQIKKIIQVLLKTAKVQIPEMLIEEQLNKKLSDLIDQLQKVGVTIENYAASKNKTVPQIIQEYRQQLENNLKIDLILDQIAEEEKIIVNPKEVEKISSINQEVNPYLAAYFIRQQKTIEYLANL